MPDLGSAPPSAPYDPCDDCPAEQCQVATCQGDLGQAGDPGWSGRGAEEKHACGVASLNYRVNLARAWSV